MILSCFEYDADSGGHAPPVNFLNEVSIFDELDEFVTLSKCMFTGKGVVKYFVGHSTLNSAVADDEIEI